VAQGRLPWAALQQALVPELAQWQALALAQVLGLVHFQFLPGAMEQVPAHALLPEQVLGQALWPGQERQRLPSVAQMQALEPKQALALGQGLKAQRLALLRSLQRGQLLLLHLPAYKRIASSMCPARESSRFL
jgi:hypothetical protein